MGEEEPTVMRRRVANLSTLVAECWKEMWIIFKVCADAGNASVSFLPDLWPYQAATVICLRQRVTSVTDAIAEEMAAIPTS
jgi:hypothetical protein